MITKNRMIFALILLGIAYLLVTSVVDMSPSTPLQNESDGTEKPIFSGIDSSKITDYYIYLYDISTGNITTVVSSKSILINPSIDNNRVVYTSYQNGNADIYLYDIETKETKQITFDPYEQDMARIHGDNIVWHDARNAHTEGSRVINEHDIYRYDLSTGKEDAVIRSGVPDRRPDVYGDLIIAEIYLRGMYGNIYAYNISSGELKPITSELQGHEQNRIYGNLLVWYHNSLLQVYMYDMTTGYTTKITGADGNYGVYPNIYMNKIVYSKGLFSDQFDIYVYDLVSEEEKQITNTPGIVEILPDIYENMIVYTREESADKRSIHLYDLKTEKELDVKSPSEFNHAPEISGDNVIWFAFDVSKK